jgi:hypothetical protein
MAIPQLTNTLLGVILTNSACILFILVHRTDTAAKVAFEVIPHLQDISHAADATRAVCGKRHNQRIRMPRDAQSIFDTFPEHELVPSLQRSEALLIHAIIKLQNPANILVLSDSLDATRVILASTDSRVTAAISSLTAATTSQLLQTHANLRISSAGPEHFTPEGKYDLVYFDGTDTAASMRAFRRLPLALNCLVLIHGTGTHAHTPKYIPWDNTTTAKDMIQAEQHGKGAVTTNKGPGVIHNPAMYELTEQIVHADESWTKIDLMSSKAWRHGVSVLQVRREIEDEDY